MLKSLMGVLSAMLVSGVAFGDCKTGQSTPVDLLSYHVVEKITDYPVGLFTLPDGESSPIGLIKVIDYGLLGRVCFYFDFEHTVGGKTDCCYFSKIIPEGVHK